MTETLEIASEREILYDRLADRLETAFNLNRKVVSFQANKEEPIYRWFKYKEGFSSALVKYFLTEYGSKPGKLLDPFAGAGTTLFAGQELGWEAHGVEILPVGVFVMQTREALNKVDFPLLQKTVKSLWNELAQMEKYEQHIHHISITKDAFPDETEVLLNKFLSHCLKIEDTGVQTLLRFAAFSVLEEISYTRKDGQYLRWDYRSKRELNGKPFDKGKIQPFEEALKHKLNQILADLSPNKSATLFDQYPSNGNDHQQIPINIIKGSCLEELPKIEADSFDFILTSPPYCNRYDYTRTYALELIYLGNDKEQITGLRQSMLSCTVENKEKIEYLKHFYASIGKQEIFDEIIGVYEGSAAMTEVNSFLAEFNKLDKLNNKNVPRMVKNYFLEMCFVVYEMARITRSGGYCVMVNDNVRYGGEEIPVDLILSEFAENFGFNINKIFVLPKGKGNSSQQMGNYGRTEIRKCVYLWQKK
ncbi:MAG: site-specific DNA-methyltransferase [Saprospiraceae bacterium]|jgi:DNA modification methylase|nr:site-specific DNA-methyltransferase [Saprospiraceae bacterium]